MAINSLSSMSNGLAGLASGMDTQSMVDAALAGTQAKIDKQKANKTILGYKQTMYREIFSSLSNLQTTFLSGGGSNNMLLSGLYNSMSALSKATAFKVSATSDAAQGKTVINAIKQLARSAQLKTASGVNITGDVKGELALDKLAGQEIMITLDGVRKTIKMPTNPDGGVMSAQDFKDALQTSINKEFGNGLSVSVTGNEIKFTASDISREFVIHGKEDAMAVLGMKTGASNKLNLNNKLGDLNFAKELQGEAFEFTINGEQFKFTAEDTMDKVISVINNSNANVKLRYSALEDKFVMESTVSGKDVNLKVDSMTQQSGNLLTALFGVGTGGEFTGKAQFSYDDMTGGIMGSTYKKYGPGETVSAEDQQKIADLFSSMNTEINRLTASEDFKFTMNVDGSAVEITLPKRELSDPADPDSPLEEYTVDDLVTAINDNATLQAKGISVALEKDDAGNLTGGVKMDVPAGVKIENSIGIKGLFGFDLSNEKAATGDSTLASLGIGDFAITPDDGLGPINITDNMTLDQVADALKQRLGPDATVEVDDKGRFRIFGVDIPMSLQVGAEGKKLFGVEEIKLNQSVPAGEQGVFTSGENAKLVINGVEVERNSNEFTIDGLIYELKSTFNTAEDPDVSEDISVTRDTDKIFDAVSKFMDEYNKMLDKVWGKLKEDPTYRDYKPLTDKQKEAMSDREVELWEQKSKEGLLRGDDALEGIMESMRRALIAKPAGCKYSLAEMGISVTYDLEKGYGGKLVFNDDAKTGEKFKEMIAQEPEAIEQLFTNNTNGILVEMNKVIRGATVTDDKLKVPYSQYSLANLAGRPGFPDTSSSIFKQMRDINDNLDNLNVKYKAEYARYWKQYNAMEQMISNMNQQSSWLTQQFQ